MVNEWSVLSLDKALDINPRVQLEKDKVYPFVDMKSINPSVKDVHSSEYRVFRGQGSRFRDGDTLLARITPCLENGKIARYVSNKDVKVAHGSTEFIVIRGREGVTDNLFAYYLARSEIVCRYLISQMSGSSGRQRVPVRAFAELTIELPPLIEQRAIAGILGALDDKIELNRQMCKTLEDTAQAIFKSWFIDFDPVHAKAAGKQPKGMNPAIAALFPDSFDDSHLIPKGWSLDGLDSLGTFLNGLALQKYPPTDDEWLPAIKIAQLRTNDTRNADKVSSSIGKEYIVKDGDILFSWSGSLECVLWSGGKGALNQHLFKVTSTDYPKWFVYFWIHHHLPEFRHIAAGKATTMGHIQRHHLKEAKVIIPSSNILEIANRIIDPLFENIVIRSLESKQLEYIRDLLLPQLISGSLRVSDAENIINRCR
jgi:type I restriction enzyme S subunit